MAGGQGLDSIGVQFVVLEGSQYFQKVRGMTQKIRSLGPITESWKRGQSGQQPVEIEFTYGEFAGDRGNREFRGLNFSKNLIPDVTQFFKDRSRRIASFVGVRSGVTLAVQETVIRVEERQGNSASPKLG